MRQHKIINPSAELDRLWVVKAKVTSSSLGAGGVVLSSDQYGWNFFEVSFFP